MPKFQFERSSGKGKTKHLMTKTNSEDRFAANQTADCLVGVRQRLRISGAVGKKNALRVEREHFLSCGCGRDNGDAESALPQRSENVAFHSIIERANAMPDRPKHLITALQRPFPAQSNIRIPSKHIRRSYFAHV